MFYQWNFPVIDPCSRCISGRDQQCTTGPQSTSVMNVVCAIILQSWLNIYGRMIGSRSSKSTYIPPHAMHSAYRICSILQLQHMLSTTFTYTYEASLVGGMSKEQMHQSRPQTLPFPQHQMYRITSTRKEGSGNCQILPFPKHWMYYITSTRKKGSGNLHGYADVAIHPALWKREGLGTRLQMHMHKWARSMGVAMMVN